MKGKTVLSVILPPAIFALGYFMGVWVHPQLAELFREKKEVSVASLFSDDVVILNGETHLAMDTLSVHKKNLLVFWTPSCKFCRQFFQSRLNSEVVGVFCFPLSDDYEYVEYFVNHHEIPYPQLVKKTPDGISPVDAPFAEAVPMFIVVDSNGNVLQKQIGVSGIDELTSTLYK